MQLLIVIIGCVLLISAVWLFLYDQNNRLKATKHVIESKKINESFYAVHLSDLHNKSFGKGNEKLLAQIKQLEPDIIFFTGDVIYKRSKHYQAGISFLKDLVGIAPVYFILGNHECEYADKDEVIRKIKETGVCFLYNETKTANIKNNAICLLGMAERLISKEKVIGIAKNFEREEGYKILLSHFPHYFSHYRKLEYKNFDIDLILSGHTHGAQIILPVIGGICAPQQGFFPKYYRGMYEENHTKMIVSRGLGKSIFPFRIFNRPEIGVIQFKQKNS